MRPLAILVAALAFVAPAAAHITDTFHGKTIRATLKFQERQYAHSRYVCVRGSGEIKRWHCAASVWIRRELRETRAKMVAPVPYGKWDCIYRHERGADGWQTNTGNGYYGGLQMDMGFQRTYGPEFMARWGTADNWPVWAQITAAERAYHGYNGYGARGFGPWPNTARACGLL